MMRWRALAIVVLLACSRSSPDLATDRAAPEAAPSEDWNASAIDWQPYDAGLALAKRENKPVCLVLYTTWCPHCKNYSRIFADPRLVERAHDFVMIRVDADANDAVSSRYHPDGTYIPRTFFLNSDGEIDTTVQTDNPRFRYFFDEKRADSLLAAMDRAAPRKL